VGSKGCSQRPQRIGASARVALAARISYLRAS
jgi:hypothetical protein